MGLCSLPDTSCLLVALASGHLLQVSTETCDQVEEVGSVPAGLAAMALSPDLELLTLVTCDLRVVTMTRDFQEVGEVALVSEEEGEGRLISLGWGKKETQFHGTEGKAARVVVQEEGGLVAGDDGRVRISWRGDGQMVAVSCVVAGEGDKLVRKVKVLTREGNLYSTSAPLPGLEQSLAWRPSGAQLAVTILKPEKRVVGFLEKNGLQHGELVLRGEGRVVELAWSCDSSVLLVWLERSSGHVLQLWTTGNYHWYLKQEIDVEGEVVAPSWSSVEAGTLHWLVRRPCGREEVRTLRLGWTTHSGGDLATVAVVDGSTVKLTPFREVVVPPPSSALELDVGEQVLGVAWSSGGGWGGGTLARVAAQGDSLLLVTASKVVVFELGSGGEEQGAVRTAGVGGVGYAVQGSRWRLTGSLSCPLLASLTSFVWLGSRLVASRLSSPGLVVLREQEEELVVEQELECEAPVWGLVGRVGGAVVQLEGGQLLEMTLGEQGCSTLVPAPQSFPCTCDTLLTTEHGSLGLSSGGRLLLGDREIARGVTSVALHSAFLLATTTEHRLVALPRTSLPTSSPAWDTAGTRRVERGSRLVVVVPRHSRTVLQMPRGNLEVVQPRSLSLLTLGELLASGNWAEAFLLARRQRMNLNLLVDHDREAFSRRVVDFVAQVGARPDHMNIFLADLVEEDVCATMYSAQYPGRKGVEGGGKVSAVCTQVGGGLRRTEGSYYRVAGARRAGAPGHLWLQSDQSAASAGEPGEGRGQAGGGAG